MKNDDRCSVEKPQKEYPIEGTLNPPPQCLSVSHTVQLFTSLLPPVIVIYSPFFSLSPFYHSSFIPPSFSSLSCLTLFSPLSPSSSWFSSSPGPLPPLYALWGSSHPPPILLPSIFSLLLLFWKALHLSGCIDRLTPGSASMRTPYATFIVSKIRLFGGSETQVSTFWKCFYRRLLCFIHPTLSIAALCLVAVFVCFVFVCFFTVVSFPQPQFLILYACSIILFPDAKRFGSNALCK